MSTETTGGKPTGEDVRVEGFRAIALLSERGAYAVAAGCIGAIRVNRRGVTLHAGAVSAAALARLEADGLLERKGFGRQEKWILSGAGLSAAARLREGARPPELAARRMELALRPDPQGEATLLVNEGESPLLWLRRRKGRSGNGLIGDDEFAAGEQLRNDLARARLAPSLSQDWTRAANQSGYNPAGLNATEANIAARQRVKAAMDAVGPEFSGLLIDVCGFLKPIETIERERGWPARSAKVVLCLALGRLARHYGIGVRRGRGAPTRSWSDGASRPSFPEAAQSA